MTVTRPEGAGASPKARGHIPDVPGYILQERVGSGAMGDVWRALERGTGRVVALKLLHPGSLSDDAIRRFELEVAVTASLDHPNVARLYHSQLVVGGGAAPDRVGPDSVSLQAARIGGAAQGPPLGAEPAQGYSAAGTPRHDTPSKRGQLLYAMEYVAGGTLEAWGDEHEGQVRQAVGIMLKVCRAVQHAHQRGVIHRDLKLQNVMVGEDGEPKVVDFGLAKLVQQDASELATLTAHGAILGTPAYMSPEQIAGDTVDTRTDVYALGVMLFRLTTGRAPIPTDGKLLAFFNRVMTTPPTRPRTLVPGFDADLEAVLMRALEVAPSDRYGDAGALADDLERYLSGLPVEARGAGTGYVIYKALSRHRGRVLVGTLLVAAMIAMVGASYYWVLQERDAARRAEQTATRAEAEAKTRLQASRAFASALVTELPQWVYRGPTEVRIRVVQRASERLASLRAEAGNDQALALDYARSLHEVAVTKRELTRAGIGEVPGRSPAEDLAEVLALFGRHMPAATPEQAVVWRRLAWEARYTQVVVAGRGQEAETLAAGLADDLRGAATPEHLLLGRLLVRQSWIWGTRKGVAQVERAMDEAEQHYEAVTSLVDRKLGLSYVAAQRGWTHRVADNSAKAAQHYRKAVELLDGIPKSHSDLRVLRAQALALSSLAWTYQNYDVKAALAASARAATLRDLDAAADPANLTAQRERGWIRVRRALVLAAAGKATAAIQSCDEAIAILTPQLDTARLRAFRDASAAFTVQAGIFADHGHWAAARTALVKAQRILDRVDSGDRSGRMFAQAQASTAWHRASAAVSSGEPQAGAHLDRLDASLAAYAPHRNAVAATRDATAARLWRARWHWGEKRPEAARLALKAALEANTADDVGAAHPYLGSQLALMRAQYGSDPHGSEPSPPSASVVLAGLKPPPPGTDPMTYRATLLLAHRVEALGADSAPLRSKRAQGALDAIASMELRDYESRFHREVLRVIAANGRPPSDEELNRARRLAVYDKLTSGRKTTP